MIKYKSFKIEQATDQIWPDEVRNKWLGMIDATINYRYIKRRYVTPDGTLVDRCGDDVWFDSPDDVRAAIDKYF